MERTVWRRRAPHTAPLLRPRRQRRDSAGTECAVVVRGRGSDRPAERIPGEVEDRSAVIELDAVDHEHDAALGSEPRSKCLVVAVCERGERQKVAEDPARVALVQGQLARVEVAGDLRERDAFAQMSLADMEGDVEAVDTARERDAQVLGRVRMGRAPEQSDPQRLSRRTTRTTSFKRCT